VKKCKTVGRGRFLERRRKKKREASTLLMEIEEFSDPLAKGGGDGGATRKKKGHTILALTRHRTKKFACENRPQGSWALKTSFSETQSVR